MFVGRFMSWDVSWAGLPSFLCNVSTGNPIVATALACRHGVLAKSGDEA
jgi:hypothetical protein